MLATGAVVVVHRRHFQLLLTGEIAQNAFLSDSSRSLTVERNAIAARIAVLETSLAEYKAEQMAAIKAADDARAVLMQSKEFQ